MDTPDLEVRRLELEEQRVSLSKQQLVLDKHWAKVWAPLIIPAMIGLAGVAITGIIQHADTLRQGNALEAQQSIEDARAAADMYFDKLNIYRTTGNLSQTDQDRYVEALNIVKDLTNNPDIKSILLNEASQIAAGRQEQSKIPTSGLQTDKPSQAVQGLPDLVIANAVGNYQPSSFLAFPQVPGTDISDDADKLTIALADLGFKVQQTQRMALGKSPQNDQIRYYRADQKPFADTVAQELNQMTGITFTTSIVNEPNLPNGVMEFWIGGP